jgi:hypothetical protein
MMGFANASVSAGANPIQPPHLPAFLWLGRHPQDWLESGRTDHGAKALGFRARPRRFLDWTSEEGGRDGGGPLLTGGSEVEQDVQSTPEGKLWLSVMLQAARHLEKSTKWLSKNLEPEAPHLRDRERANRRGRRSPLLKQVQVHVCRVRDAEQFFFGRESSFGEICELLGYDKGTCRSSVEAWLGERAGVFRKAEAFIDASRIRRPAERHREPRRGRRADRLDRHPEKPSRISG